MKSSETPKGVGPFPSVVALVVLALWLLAPLLASWSWFNATDKPSPHEAINALFSGLALVLVVATLQLQMRELRSNVQQLREQADASKRQAAVAEAQLKRAADDEVRAAIRSYRVLLNTWFDFRQALERRPGSEDVEHWHRRLRDAMISCTLLDRHSGRTAAVNVLSHAAKSATDLGGSQEAIKAAEKAIDTLVSQVGVLADRLPAI